MSQMWSFLSLEVDHQNTIRTFQPIFYSYLVTLPPNIGFILEAKLKPPDFLMWNTELLHHGKNAKENGMNTREASLGFFFTGCLILAKIEVVFLLNSS